MKVQNRAAVTSADYTAKEEISMKYFHSLYTFFKREAVLCIAAFLAVISAFIVHPSPEYLNYIDYRVLALLFCLMLVVAGLQDIGVFQRLGQRLLEKVSSTRQLALLLVGLCFFSSMLITNDVALITFVPFTVMVLSIAEQEALMIPVIVLQTIGANLGSMLTPVGNPQNLYLYSAFSIPAGIFLLYMLPLTLLSALLLTGAVLLLKNRTLGSLPDSSMQSFAPRESRTARNQQPVPPESLPPSQAFPAGKLAAYLLLAVVCLLCVARVLPWQAMLAILVVSVFFIDRRLFQKIDLFLLLTFVCFFLFIGNMERIPAIADLLRSFIGSRELPLGILFSQVISNVPAAILLSGFTDAARPLLYGVNIGGLGTLIASLASVISYRLYGNRKGAAKGAYLKTFTVYNLAFLLPLYLAAWLLLSFG